MGGYVTKRRMMFLQLLLTQIMLLHLFISSSSGEKVNSSENVGGRSHQPYALEGKLSQSADLEFKDLNMCNMFHEKTCCSASSRMLSVTLALQNLAAHGEASKDCLYFFELLECSICHPDAGVQSRPLRICASFCDRVFEACSDAYFSSDVSHQVIVPCDARKSIICMKLSKWGTNGTAFCEAVGFTVAQTADDKPCYGPVVKPLIKTESGAWFQDLKKLVREMTLVQQLSWVVALSAAVASYDPEGCEKIDKEH